MDLFSVISCAGGLAFFLYGMHVMSGGLEKMAGGRLEETLKKMTSNPVRGFFLGAGITIAIQSSSAMTVMLVGLVNSGIMELSQTVGIIMGSNVGTTLTAWVLSLTGIESNNFFLRLLKPESFAPVFALVGILLLMISKNSRKKDMGTIFLGFSILMSGMNLMSSSVSPLASMPGFTEALTLFRNPLLGVLVGAAFTGIIQSSAASVGILQALSLTGSISYGMALPIIMGQNIGTCVTALLSSIGTNKNAKRVAVIHVYFNLIGTLAGLLILLLARQFGASGALDAAVGPVGIAMLHSAFNILATALLLPFGKQLVKLAQMTVRDKGAKTNYEFLDERLLKTPFTAIAQSMSSAIEMSKLAHNSLTLAIGEVNDYSPINATVINENEDTIDYYEDKLGSYLVKLSAHELTDEESKRVAMLLHSLGDFERVGDHALNILDAAQELHEKKIFFSNEAKADLKVMTDAVTEISYNAIKAFENSDVELAKTVEPLEQVIDDLKEDVLDRHIARLQQGQCTIELGFVLSDLVTNLERVSDHCSNIAARVIKKSTENFELHGYIHDMKEKEAQRYNNKYEEYSRKYTLDGKE
ncbi:MAG: Na/Pi cotransporter family protein [Oscillospiraceae bacterium]|nr:Na/Pi cotransporter family protein [Oscillospiraceae bacterium]